MNDNNLFELFEIHEHYYRDPFRGVFVQITDDDWEEAIKYSLFTLYKFLFDFLGRLNNEYQFRQEKTERK